MWPQVPSIIERPQSLNGKGRLGEGDWYPSHKFALRTAAKPFPITEWLPSLEGWGVYYSLVGILDTNLKPGIFTGCTRRIVLSRFCSLGDSTGVVELSCSPSPAGCICHLVVMLVQVENCADEYCLSVTKFTGGESLLCSYTISKSNINISVYTTKSKKVKLGYIIVCSKA